MINEHQEFLKSQAERYALCMAFLTAGFLCLKYMHELFYVFGLVSGVSLLVVALFLFLNNIKAAELYVEENLAPKKTIKFTLFGAVYATSVICVGYAIFFEAVS